MLDIHYLTSGCAEPKDIAQTRTALWGRALNLLDMEEWKAIPNTNGKYEVSDLGRVRTFKRHNKGAHLPREKPLVLKINYAPNYPTVMLRNDEGRWTEGVHKLVAKAFIPNPENKPCVNHKDGNKRNNKISNLEWVTHSENTQHAYENGLMNPPEGEDHWNSKLTETDILDIRATYATGWFYQREIAEAYGVARSLITNIVNHKYWKHV